MSTLQKLSLGVIGALVAASPLLAHHDWLVDRTKQVTVQGTVTAFTWANPHVMIALDVQANGTIERWKVGGSSPKFMAACGWDKKTLKPGDVITVIGYRFNDGSNAAQAQTILMPNGKEMYYGAPTPPQCVPPVADRVVVDRTGLKGNYDVLLEWTPEPRPFVSAADLPPGLPSLRRRPLADRQSSRQFRNSWGSSCNPTKVSSRSCRSTAWRGRARTDTMTRRRQRC